MVDNVQLLKNVSVAALLASQLRLQRQAIEAGNRALDMELAQVFTRTFAAIHPLDLPHVRVLLRDDPVACDNLEFIFRHGEKAHDQ